MKFLGQGASLAKKARYNLNYRPTGGEIDYLIIGAGIIGLNVAKVLAT